MNDINILKAKTGVTNKEISVEFGATASMLNNTIKIPAGTTCRKLDSDSDHWIVEDLSFIKPQHSILYHEAYYYGIYVPDEFICDPNENSPIHATYKENKSSIRI